MPMKSNRNIDQVSVNRQWTKEKLDVNIVYIHEGENAFKFLFICTARLLDLEQGSEQ